MTQKSLFTPIAARLGFVFIDQYGVLHDGQRPYPGAIEALATLKATGKTAPSEIPNA